jgi:hypothetical protein
MADPTEEKRDQPKAPEGMTPEDAAARLNQILSSPMENPFASEPRQSGSHPPSEMPAPKPAPPPPPSPREDATPKPAPDDPAPATAAPEPRPSVPPEFAAWEGATASVPETAPQPASAPSTEAPSTAESEARPARESEAPRPVLGPAPTREAPPRDREGLGVIVKVRRLMLISTVLTALALATVLGIIGYRLFRSEGRQDAAVQATLTLPAGAKIVQTAIAEDRIVLTLEIGGSLEIRTYDLKTLKPMGRLTFSSVP